MGGRAARALATLLALVLFSLSTSAQDKKKSGFQEVYTGTIASTNGPLRTTSFNLSIKDFTTDEEANRYLGILAEGDQDNLLDAIKDLDLGRLSTTGTVGRRLIVARKVQLPDGRTRITAAFERWQSFAEVRSGSRVQDYPFGLMEIILEPGGKKGSGTFIAACKIELKRDKKTGKYQLELENFGTYPNKVMGVMRR
jgi:hypothetical protein